MGGKDLKRSSMPEFQNKQANQESEGRFNKDLMAVTNWKLNDKVGGGSPFDTLKLKKGLAQSGIGIRSQINYSGFA